MHIEPAAALLGFAQTLTALDLFKLQRQLQQNFMLNSVATGMATNSQGPSHSARFRSAQQYEPVHAPGRRVDSVAQSVEVVESEGLMVDCDGSGGGGEMGLGNPVSLCRKASPTWSNDSRDSGKRNKDGNVRAKKEEYYGSAYQMVMNGKECLPAAAGATKRDDKCKSDYGESDGGNQGSVAAASVVVSDDKDDDGRNDEVAVDPDCVKHDEGINRCQSPAMVLVTACPSLSTSVVAGAAASTTSFTIENLIGRRT